MSHRARTIWIVSLLVVMTGASCARRQTGIATPGAQSAPQPAPVTATPPSPPQRLEEAGLVPPAGLGDEGIMARSLDDLNRNSPLQPVYFALDSAELDEMGRRAATANADLLKANPGWVITIEGHCDERGTAEYNLALGERRAVAVRTYLLSLGIGQERLRTVSYGKEFPFDSGHNEDAWSRNRRAHFVIASR